MDPIETMERDGVAKGEGEAQESEESTSHAAHLAAMWAGQSNVVVALRIRPVVSF